MADIAVIVPVLGRPANAQPLVQNLLATAPDAWLLFMCSPDDIAQIDACELACSAPRTKFAVVPWEAGPGDYAAKINLAYRNTAQVEMVLLGADDIRFHPGWLEAVEAVAAKYDCGVVGTNDMGNPEVLAGRHSTHPVVRRCYIDRYGGVVGEPGVVYHEGYDHQMVDNELVATAQARGCYAHAHDARVEHLHYLWRKSQRDSTYEKGRRGGQRDLRLFNSRKHLWENERVTA